jgi:ketosteroid isomerase-like protein
VSQENVDVARRAFALWTEAMTDSDDSVWRAALREMIEQFHPQAELDFTRTTPDLTGDREAMASWVERARDTYASLHIDTTDWLDAGDAVVLTARFTGQGAASGIALTAEIAYVVRCRDGQIVSETSFSSRQEALGAAGLTK